MSSINLDVILENPESLQCSCKISQYVDKDHGHILTDNPHKSSDNKLCKIFYKGLKIRESECPNFYKAKSIVEGIDNFVNTWCNK